MLAYVKRSTDFREVAQIYVSDFNITRPVVSVRIVYKDGKDEIFGCSFDLREKACGRFMYGQTPLSHVRQSIMGSAYILYPRDN